MQQLNKYLEAVANSFYLNKCEFKEEFFNLLKEYEISENFASDDIAEVLTNMLGDISVYLVDINTGLFCFKHNDNEYDLNIFTDNATGKIERVEAQIAREIEMSYKYRWMDNDLPSWVDRRGL